MDAAVIIALIAAGGAVLSSFFTWRSSNKATSIEGRKVDQEAYDKAQKAADLTVEFYERRLADADKQIDRLTVQADRLTTQLEKMNKQLSEEQIVSDNLRHQVYQLKVQVNTLNITIATLKAGMSKKGA